MGGSPHPCAPVDARYRGRGGCSGGATRAGGQRRRELVGGGAPVRVGRGEVVWELREVEAQLLGWSAWAGRLRRGGSTAASSSPVFGVERRRRSELWEWGKGKRTRGEAFWDTCSAAACENSRAGALCRPSHGGGEVATGGRPGARGRAERAPARGGSGSRGQGG